MFARIPISLLFVAALVAASPSPSIIKNTTNACYTGPTHCCETNGAAGAAPASIRELLRRSRFGHQIGDDNTNVATGCVAHDSKIQCNSQPVCCDSNNLGSTGDDSIVVGCTSIGGSVTVVSGNNVGLGSGL